MGKSVVDDYQERVRQGGLCSDAAQMTAAAKFDDLAAALGSWRQPSGGLFKWFGGRGNVAPRGLYLFGGVGRGKTMLMDLFFDLTTFEPRRRVHFHEFMAEIHDGIAAARRMSQGDPIPIVASGIAKRSRLLCFDELHVTDIADAMILGRLFEALFADGVVVVATSNVAPDGLYKNGLNRNLFVPFIRLIGERMEVFELVAEEDYRLAKLAGRPLYFTPADDRARGQMAELWVSLAGGAEGGPASVMVKGRRVEVPRAANGVAWFDFEDLCAKPLGSGDYLSIARSYHTVMIENVPILTPAKRNEARRFINLIDTLYDAKVGLVISAEGEVGDIYKEGDGAFLFERTASRLIEMRSEAYLAARSQRADVAGNGQDTVTTVSSDT